MHRKHCVVKLTFFHVSVIALSVLYVFPPRSPEEFVWVIVQPASLLLQSTLLHC